jgi:NADH dehydrogenase FAD-containing subunit
LKRVVVVGSGAGGTLTANLLAHALRREIRHGEVSIELLGENLYHPFQPANLDVAFKGASLSKFVRTEEELLRDEVRFIHDRVSLIDMNERQVTTETGRIIKYDYLLLATGAVADPSLIPGLEEGRSTSTPDPKTLRRSGRLSRLSKVERWSSRSRERHTSVRLPLMRPPSCSTSFSALAGYATTRTSGSLPLTLEPIRLRKSHVSLLRCSRRGRLR